MIELRLVRRDPRSAWKCQKGDCWLSPSCWMVRDTETGELLYVCADHVVWAYEMLVAGVCS